VGGTITFSAETYDISGGTREHDTLVGCPGKVKVRVMGETAGPTIRGVPKLALSTSPTFVLVGTHATRFLTIEVAQQGQVVLTAPLQGRRFQWPAGTAPLTAGTEYELTLRSASHDVKPIALRFVATTPSQPPGAQDLMLLSVE
jgi:hypothetical protein